MKKILFLALVFPLLLACNKEEDVQDSIVKMATVENPSQLTNFYLNLEDSTRLWVLSNDIKYYRPKNEQRVIVDYTILTEKPRGSTYDYDVKVNDVYEVLTKGIFPITALTQDSIGNDPIAITGLWVSGDFLNVEFVYPGYSKIHNITLASDDSKTYTDGKVHLEFRHNANDDYPSFNISGIVCFNLKTIRKS
ncbi:MAG: NigD-like protein, partial [Paludibacter sp.]